MVSRWPRSLRKWAQRTAVTRFPLRERGGAGQAMKMSMQALYSPQAWLAGQRPQPHDRLLAAADRPAAVGGERHRPHRPRRPLEETQLAAGLHLPKPHGARIHHRAVLVELLVASGTRPGQQ